MFRRSTERPRRRRRCPGREGQVVLQRREDVPRSGGGRAPFRAEPAGRAVAVRITGADAAVRKGRDPDVLGRDEVRGRGTEPGCRRRGACGGGCSSRCRCSRVDVLHLSGPVRLRRSRRVRRAGSRSPRGAATPLRVGFAAVTPRRRADHAPRRRLRTTERRPILLRRARGRHVFVASDSGCSSCGRCGGHLALAFPALGVTGGRASASRGDSFPCSGDGDAFVLAAREGGGRVAATRLEAGRAKGPGGVAFHLGVRLSQYAELVSYHLAAQSSRDWRGEGRRCL